MPVTSASLQSPQGELDPAVLWPGQSGSAVDTILNGFIADGQTRVGSLTGDAADAAVTLWAQYRAYLSRYQTALGEATSGDLVDQGRFAFLWSQIEAWKKLADEKRALFDAAAGEETGGLTSSAIPSPAVARLEFTW